MRARSSRRVAPSISLQEGPRGPKRRESSTGRRANPLASAPGRSQRRTRFRRRPSPGGRDRTGRCGRLRGRRRSGHVLRERRLSLPLRRLGGGRGSVAGFRRARVRWLQLIHRPAGGRRGAGPWLARRTDPMAVGSSNDFDLVVLDAGTGGYTAAFRAAQLGLKVALVDEDKIGGTCLHRGCIPTKALLESAAFTEKVRHAKDMGLKLPGDPEIDYAQMAARRDQVVKRMWTGLKTLVDKNKVAWIQGRGRLEGPNKVRIAQTGEDGTPGKGGDRVLQATDVIIATG